jgi:hypothetical protein
MSDPKTLDDILKSDEKPTKENVISKFYMVDNQIKILANNLKEMQAMNALKTKEAM